jgi:uncharacterized protein (TIGR02611 family)
LDSNDGNQHHDQGQHQPRWLQRAEQRLQQQRQIHAQRHWLPRVFIAGLGFVVLLTGIAMLVLPGPAVLVIPLGLGILSLEFAWARYLLAHSARLGQSLQRRWKMIFKLLLAMALIFALSAALALLLLL